MSLLKVICWTLIFIIKLHFPPGVSITPYSLKFGMPKPQSSIFLKYIEDITQLLARRYEYYFRKTLVKTIFYERAQLKHVYTDASCKRLIEQGRQGVSCVTFMWQAMWENANLWLYLSTVN